MIRKAEIKRTTSETDILVRLNLDDGNGSALRSGVPFFDHMLNSMASHGRFHLVVECSGDLEVDDHHTVEDVGICIGKAFKKALGDKAGIERFGSATVPMDDSLTMVAVDLSGRAFFKYSGRDLKGVIGKYSEELTVEFLRAFAQHGEFNLHVQLLYGENDHHAHESIFKALGVALRKAFSVTADRLGDIPSTKGTL